MQDDVAQRDLVGEQRLARADRDGVGHRVRGEDVARLGRAAASEPAALADGEAVRAAVAADDRAVAVDDRPGELPEPAVPGQAAVLLAGDLVVGCATIGDA